MIWDVLPSMNVDRLTDASRELAPELLECGSRSAAAWSQYLLSTVQLLPDEVGLAAVGCGGLADFRVVHLRVRCCPGKYFYGALGMEGGRDGAVSSLLILILIIDPMSFSKSLLAQHRMLRMLRQKAARVRAASFSPACPVGIFVLAL
jgi:hypothetical protein